MELKDDSLCEYVGIKVDKDNVNKMVFRSSDMDIPFIRFDDNMWNYFETELNSFHRAFTVWTGKSVTEYKEETDYGINIRIHE